MGGISKWLRGRTSAELLFYSYFSLILIGTALLAQPVSARAGKASVIDAFFTATSAVCVTGLAVFDIRGFFNGFGQAVVLSLIQLGGFGIMSFSTIIIFLLGGRASIKIRETLHETFPEVMGWSLRQMLVRAAAFMLAAELIGAVLLFAAFSKERSLPLRAWQAAFHSISAFCNAGFSLFSDNLIGYADSTPVNLVVMALIILGGIGFVVVLELGQAARQGKRLRKISLHSKMVLLMSAVLIVLGAALILGFEWKYQMAATPFKGKMLRAFFQSITARTCGYNTVEIGMMSEASLVVLIALMFIGGAPGSTAGGVKVTTAAVIMALAISLFRAEKRPTIFGRSLTGSSMNRALLLIVAAFLIVNALTLGLLISEGGLVASPQNPGIFLKLIFEATSAFGTVGLSTGITPKLSSAGKLMISALMLLGKLGPLSLIYVLQGARREKVAIEYPEEEIMIG